MRSVMKGSLIAAAVLASSVSASAATKDPSGWVGGLFGLSIPNANNTTARPMFGITGGAKLGSEWGVGAYYLTSSKDETAGITTSKFQYDLYGVELAYHFEGEARGVYLGGRLGTSKVSVGLPSGTASTSPMHWGAVAGYNHFLTDNLSLGGEASFMSVPSSNTTLAGGAVNVDSFTMLNFLASAKIWF